MFGTESIAKTAQVQVSGGGIGGAVGSCGIFLLPAFSRLREDVPFFLQLPAAIQTADEGVFL